VSLIDVVHIQINESICVMRANIEENLSVLL